LACSFRSSFIKNAPYFRSVQMVNFQIALSEVENVGGGGKTRFVTDNNNSFEIGNEGVKVVAGQVEDGVDV